MISHSIKPLELPIKNIKIAKNLVERAVSRYSAAHNRNDDKDYEFLRNSKIGGDSML